VYIDVTSEAEAKSPAAAAYRYTEEEDTRSLWKSNFSGHRIIIGTASSSRSSVGC